MVNFAHKVGGCLKLPCIDSSSTVVQWGKGWLRFSPGMMGYKAQVVASAIALPIHRKIEKSGFSPRMMGYKAQVVASAIALPICLKFEKSGRNTVDFVNFRGLKPPHTVVNQGGSWVGFVEGNESFKMVMVAASKNSTSVGQNRPWKIGG
ncbi:S2-RNase [Pyrus ussuriensis x Pyrus communis]|uniref:S2-RNase n=1 Tax=Pyrus ussuriensis x Pyrus communis TaxID=2448454 RepID=A0A5N5FEV4_9ROSA|nr:S2-RNase [Pyrus ussuriensis x Pyrus communis]